MDALGAWQAAGTEWVMLPSGVEVRVEPVPLVELVRTGFLPGQLRILALRLSGGTELPTPTPEDVAAAEELQRLMIRRWVSGLRWSCSCAECSARRGPEPMAEQPFSLTPEVLAAEPPLIPRVDLVALSDMVTYARTGRQVDALSRLAHGLLEADEAGRIIDAELPRTVVGWASFRHGGRGLDAPADGADIPRPAVLPRRARRAADRATHRRGAGRPALGGGSSAPSPS